VEAVRAHDATVVGSGPNGLAAAIELARAGRSVHLVEAAETVGGGTRSAELTLPGFIHDVCSAVHPLALASPFFRSCPLGDYGLEFLHPGAPLAHPLDGGRAAVAERSLERTCQGLGRDGAAYGRLLAPLVDGADALIHEILGPLRPPRHPLVLARFAWRARSSAVDLAARRFREEGTRALFGGLAAHSILPLSALPSAAYGLMLAVTAHAWGWPVARGGSQLIADSLARYLRSLGGDVVTGRPIQSLDDLPAGGLTLFDVTPRQLAAIAGSALPTGYRGKLERFRYGAGVHKVDWALDGPIPWEAEGCRRAGTVHVGGTLEEIAAAEAAVHRGEHPERPFVILAQPSLVDPSRAPAGKHTAWAYCHVPNGSTVDMTDRIEAQVERFAPGFRNRIIGRSVMSPGDLERYNPNYVGGDINGGAGDLRQLFTRPTWMTYRTPNRGIYLCSSSTPPTGGVHGMCGYFAARTALRQAR
jgi:phytoene dehydrogenase-like protein